MDDFKLEMATDMPPAKIAKDSDKFQCKVHLRATKDDFIEIEVKRSKKKLVKCRFCVKALYEDKKIRKEEWEREKKEITPYYVRRILVMGKGKKLPMHEYPQELVETKQAIIRLKRMTEPDADESLSILKICAHHGELTRSQLTTSGKHENGKISYRCKACLKKAHAKHYEANKDKVLSKQYQYRAENSEKVKKCRRESARKREHLKRIYERERRRQWALLNPEKEKERRLRHAANLQDCYVKKVLTNSGVLKHGDIPKEMIEAKRAIMLLRRQLKNKRKLIKMEKANVT